MATRPAHGGCNCVADSWFRVVAVICCSPVLQSEKKGPLATQDMAGPSWGAQSAAGDVDTLGSTSEAGGRGHPGDVYQCSVSASCAMFPVGAILQRGRSNRYPRTP